jgi:hypothetical protein
MYALLEKLTVILQKFVWVSSTLGSVALFADVR